MSYIYFDVDGRLREYVTTPKRKGSENVDTLFVYWEGNDGTTVLPSQCFIEYGHENIHAGPLVADAISKTIIPFNRERDLKFFQYGKTYQFMCFNLPTAVSSTSGFWHSSVSIHDRLTNNVVQVLGDITFEVEESSIVPSGNLDLSQYNYILDKVNQTVAKYDSKLDRKVPTSIVDSNENSIVDFSDSGVTFYKPTHVNNEFRVKNDTGIIIEGGDGSGKFSSILDDYDLNEFSFITDRKAFYLTFREDVTKGLVFDSSQTLSLRNGTEFLNDANTKTVFGQAIKGSGDIHTWNGTPTNPNDITTKEYVDTKVSTETEGVVKRGDLKTLNGESLLGSENITYDNFLSPTSTNAVQNKTLSKITGKIPVNIPKKTYSIPSWVYQLGPHFNQYCLGHMCAYGGYTTSDYICVNATDELTLSILEGITQIRVSKYSMNDLGKIDTYLGIDTYSSTTTIVFSEKMLVKISVKGSDTPSIALAQSAVSLKSYREKEDIFVYPYGPWDYNKQYITTSATGVTENLTPGPNGDPYWNTVASGFYLNSWSAFMGKMGMSINMNYAYIKYGFVNPSLIRTAYWKKNDICRLKFGVMTLDASLLKTTSFMSMKTYDSASISEMVYTGAYSNLAYEKCLVRLELDNSPSTDFITTREQGDELFNSVFVRFGLTYDGEEIDLSKGTKGNTLKISPKGTFPFVSTQNGGQKPSCFAEYNGKLFVGCDNFGFNILNLNDLSLTATIEDSNLGHINNSEFMEEFFSSDDTYPLMLEAQGAQSYNQTLGSDYSGYFNAIRFANDLSGLTIVRKYTIPTAISGFYTSGLSYDKENKTLWVLAYKRQSYSSEADNNCLVLTSWDLSNCTQNQNGDYIPAVKTRCELTFVRTLQDTTFCNGYIFALANSPTSGKIPSELYVIDTTKQTIRKTDISRIVGFAELEAITNVYDENLDKYYLLIGEALYASFGGVNGTYGHVYRLDTANTIK